MKTDLTSGLLINSNDGLITTDLFIMELNPKILKFSLIPDSVICFQTPEVSFWISVSCTCLLHLPDPTGAMTIL